jgi:superoxide dismutase, Cu-Zn family
MMAKRRIMTRTVGLAALATALSGAPAYAAGNGATVTKASGPTYLYGTDNPLAAMHMEIHGVQTPSGKTIITLHATGLDPALAGRTFGAHVHVNACGESAAAAGAHYKNLDLPASDPEAREVWLDFTVGTDGTASSRAERPWVFVTSAGSVVVHAAETDDTGNAGARLACTDTPFHQ